MVREAMNACRHQLNAPLHSSRKHRSLRDACATARTPAPSHEYADASQLHGSSACMCRWAHHGPLSETTRGCTDQSLEHKIREAGQDCAERDPS